jgi:Domain of unknown function (DUF3471)
VKSIKVLVALIFIASAVAALSTKTFGYPPFLVKAKKFGAKDCTFCHVDPEGGPPWNDRGKWLISEKERRGAETVDVEWLVDYKPGKVADQKPADAPKLSDKPGTPEKDDKKASAPASKTGKVDPKIFDDFVGEYQVDPIGTLTITHEGDKLFGEPHEGGEKEELQPQADGSFLVTNVNAKVNFVRDDKGKVVEIQINLNGQDLKGKKIK